MNELLKRLDNETEDEMLYRLGSAKENGVLNIIWQDLADVMNQEWRTDETEWRTESAYRKRYKSYSDARKMFDKQRAENDDTLDEYALKMRELEKERIKLSTEKLEYSRWLREDARDELIAEKIGTVIQSLPALNIPTVIMPKHQTRIGTLCIADPHYGTELKITGLFGEILNEYSPEMFETRMWDLLNQTLEIADKEHFDELNVYDLGDEVDGMLRVSQLMKLRYGVIESTVRYGNFIVQWMNGLTKYVKVHYQMVKDSNHCQLRMMNQPKGTFKNENMSYIIEDKMMDRLGDNPNFKYIKNPTGYIYDQTLGYGVLGFHGETKSLESAIKDFSRTYKTNIDFLVAGHKHHGATENVGIESDILSVPSIIGIDDYSLSLHKTSDPGALLFVLEEGKGDIINYNIKL